jgi:hypothetical protein
MLSVDPSYLVVPMTGARQLDSTYGIGDGFFEVCYHQCTKCGMIFSCPAKHTASICDNPFYHGRCNICNGKKGTS